jgi:His/Glu/Gln/Arg/opine family amino acid ABC transporter permease subunit
MGLPKGSDGVAFINAFLKKLEADGTWAKLWTVSIGQRTGSTPFRRRLPCPERWVRFPGFWPTTGLPSGRPFADMEAHAVSFVPGFLLGTVVTVLRLLPLPPLRLVLTGYVEIFRNIPSVALLIFIVFALPDLNVVIDYEPSVILTLTLVCSAFTADYLRSGINTIPGSQIEAALSLGMRPLQIIAGWSCRRRCARWCSR